MRALDLLEDNKAEIADLCRLFGVRRLRLFGSALTDQWDETRSDLDFLVEYGPESRKLPPLDRLVGLQLALEDLLGLRVDVVNMDVARNPYFKKHAELLTQELYAA